MNEAIYFRAYSTFFVRATTLADSLAMDSTERPLTPPIIASDRPLLGPFHKSLAKLSQQESIPNLITVAEEEDLCVSVML